MKAAIGTVLILATMPIACVGKGKTVHPADTVEVPRQVLIQLQGKTRALWSRVYDIEMAACRKKELSEADCKEVERLNTELKTGRREITQAIETAGYEVDWAKVIKTLDGIATVLDKLPSP